MELTPILLTVIILILIYIVFSMQHRKKKTDITTNTVEAHSEPVSTVSHTEPEKHSDTSTKTASSSKKTATRKTSKMKWRNKMLDISMIPTSIELDRNTLLPQSIKREYGYGRRFNTFETSQNDFFYHRSTCKNIKGMKHNVIHRYIALQKELPCPNCQPNAQIDDWYMEFLRVNFGVDINYNEFTSQFGLSATALPENKRVNSIEKNETYLIE